MWEPASAWRAQLVDLFEALAYPFKLQSCLLIIIGGSLLWLLSSSLLAIVPVVALVTAFTHFLLRCVHDSAIGRNEPPLLGWQDFLRLGTMPLKLLIVVAVWLSIFIQTRLYSTALADALVVVGFLLLPAFTALLVLEDSLHYALSPTRLLKFVISGGFSYLLLSTVFGLCLYLGVSRIVEGYDEDAFVRGLLLRPPGIVQLGWLIGGLYLATVFANVLGRTTARAHDFEPPKGHRVADTPTVDPDSAAHVAGKLGMLFREGRKELLLSEWQRHTERDAIFQAELLDRLMQERLWGMVPMQAARTVTSELASGRHLSALQHALHILKDFSSFRTSSVNEWLQLCEIAAGTGKSEWLEILAEQAPKKFPGHSAFLRIAIMHARYVSHEQGDVARALDILAPCLADPRWTNDRELLRLQQSLLALQDA